MSKENKTVLCWTTEKRTINSLLPYEKNPRKLSKDQEEKLKESLEKMNLVEIPAIDTDDKIIAGHQRIMVLKKLGRGKEEIDVRVPNRKLTDEEYKRYLISSNAISGNWDLELLKDFEPDFLVESGFEVDDLQDIWNEIVGDEEEFNEKEELSKIKETDIKTGDLIQLGNHKLICGDSNDPEVIQHLCGDDRASMVMSDPVYNIALNYRSGLGGKRNYGADVEDSRTEEEYTEFLRKNIRNALSVTKPDSHIFYWNTEQQIYILQNLYKELGISNKRVCLWIKNGSNPTPQVAFSKCYEPCIYGTIGKPYLSTKEQGLNEVLNDELGNGNSLLSDISDQVNIWTKKRMSSKEQEHATSKPTELYYKAIKRCTKPGDIILDTFGGSGSTLLAGEKLNRKVYMVEKEPVFCQLIIKRYEKLTKKKVTKVNYHEKG